MKPDGNCSLIVLDQVDAPSNRRHFGEGIFSNGYVYRKLDEWMIYFEYMSTFEFAKQNIFFFYSHIWPKVVFFNLLLKQYYRIWIKMNMRKTTSNEMNMTIQVCLQVYFVSKIVVALTAQWTLVNAYSKYRKYMIQSKLTQSNYLFIHFSFKMCVYLKMIYLFFIKM